MMYLEMFRIERKIGMRHGRYKKAKSKVTHSGTDSLSSLSVAEDSA